MLKKLAWLWLYNPPLILIWITGLHVGWIYGLAQNDPTTLTLAALSGISIFLENGMSANLVLALLIVASILAFVGLCLEPFASRSVVIGLLLMQYVLVFIAMTSDAYVVATGNYRIRADGAYTTRHLASSITVPLLFGLIWGAALHTYAIIQRYLISYDYHKENQPKL